MKLDRKKNRWMNKGAVTWGYAGCRRDDSVTHYNESWICERCHIEELEKQIAKLEKRWWQR